MFTHAHTSTKQKGKHDAYIPPHCAAYIPQFSYGVCTLPLPRNFTVPGIEPGLWAEFWLQYSSLIMVSWSSQCVPAYTYTNKWRVNPFIKLKHAWQWLQLIWTKGVGLNFSFWEGERVGAKQIEWKLHSPTIWRVTTCLSSAKHQLAETGVLALSV